MNSSMVDFGPLKLKSTNQILELPSCNFPVRLRSTDWQIALALDRHTTRPRGGSASRSKNHLDGPRPPATPNQQLSHQSLSTEIPEKAMLTPGPRETARSQKPETGPTSQVPIARIGLGFVVRTPRRNPAHLWRTDSRLSIEFAYRSGYRRLTRVQHLLFP